MDILNNKNFNIEHIATSGQCFRWNKIDENTYYASSRGNGKINVQRICESFKDGNGGGEFDRAAVLFHIENVTIFDIKEKIKEKILELTDDVDYN